MNGCAYRIASADGALLRTPAGDPTAPARGGPAPRRGDQHLRRRQPPAVAVGATRQGAHRRRTDRGDGPDPERNVPAAPGAARSPARESAPRRTPRLLLA